MNDLHPCTDCGETFTAAAMCIRCDVRARRDTSATQAPAPLGDDPVSRYTDADAVHASHNVGTRLIRPDGVGAR